MQQTQQQACALACQLHDKYAGVLLEVIECCLSTIFGGRVDYVNKF